VVGGCSEGIGGHWKWEIDSAVGGAMVSWRYLWMNDWVS
jgi:hypothetical protein